MLCHGHQLAKAFNALVSCCTLMSSTSVFSLQESVSTLSRARKMPTEAVIVSMCCPTASLNKWHHILVKVKVEVCVV